MKEDEHPRFLFIPKVQVRADGLLIYDECIREKKELTLKRGFKKGESYAGIITEHSRRRILQAMDIMMQKSEERLIYNPILNRKQRIHITFTTLTISCENMVRHKDAMEALKIWLQHFKRPWNKRRLSESIAMYVWRAEPQQRGQIHFHIATPNFLHYIEVRRVWNDIQNSRGWLDRYKEKYGNIDPNSTDIHAARSVGRIKGYVSKYMSKNVYADISGHEGFVNTKIPLSIGGKVWGCSKNVEGKRYSNELDEETWGNIITEYGNGNIELYEEKRFKVFKCKLAKDILSKKYAIEYDKWKNA